MSIATQNALRQMQSDLRIAMEKIESIQARLIELESHRPTKHRPKKGGVAHAE